MHTTCSMTTNLGLYRLIDPAKKTFDSALAIVVHSFNFPKNTLTLGLIGLPAERLNTTI